VLPVEASPREAEARLVSESLAPQHGTEPEDIAEAPPETVASRLALSQRAGGIITPIITALVAFLIGGLVILATGHNPIQAYWDIVKGAGLNWFAHPWKTDIANTAAYNFSQTLLQTTTLILTGLAVAFAFRCGLFNIGGNGQYLVGLICANWIGVSFVNMTRPAHILLGILVASVAGAVWAGIAGFLKATVGAHEVITTIMLNWIAYWIGNYVFQQGGPLQAPQNKSLDIPISADVAHSAQLPVFWGNPQLQGLHIGFFIALGALVLFWIILNRTTLGYEVRAVGYNPAAAAYGGIKVRANYIRAMAISGAFAGLAGGLDMLGYLHHFGTIDVQASSIGFLGIAVALLGRNSAIGTGLAALLFGGLVYGTTHGLQSTAIDPSLAGHLTEMIQGLVVLFVGADVLILAIWNARRRLRRRRASAAVEPAEATP
jgi:simple sugar transport system permease protein